MRLRNGKFYDDAGNAVPLEIGNTEQYRLLQAHKSMSEGFCALEWFNCLCGTPVYRKVKVTGELIYKKHTVHCAVCGQEYEFYADGVYGVPAAKLIL